MSDLEEFSNHFEFPGPQLVNLFLKAAGFQATFWNGEYTDDWYFRDIYGMVSILTIGS